MIITREEYIKQHGKNKYYSSISILYHQTFKVNVSVKDIDTWDIDEMVMVIDNDTMVAVARYKYLSKFSDDEKQTKYFKLIDSKYGIVLYLCDLYSVRSGAGVELVNYIKSLSSIILLRAHTKELIPYYKKLDFALLSDKPKNLKGNLMLYMNKNIAKTPISDIIDIEDITILLDMDNKNKYIGELTMKNFRKKTLTAFIPWDATVDMTGVSVSDSDKELGSPKVGDMIGINPNNPEDRWLVSEAIFNDTYEEVITDDNPDGAVVVTDTTITNSVDNESFNTRFFKSLVGVEGEGYELNYVSIDDTNPDEVVEGVLEGVNQASETTKQLVVLSIDSGIYMAILNELVPIYKSFKDGIVLPAEFNWSTSDEALVVRDRLIEQIGTVVKNHIPADQQAIFVEYIPNSSEYYLFIIDDANCVYDLVFKATYANNDITLTVVPYDKVDYVAEKIN